MKKVLVALFVVGLIVTAGFSGYMIVSSNIERGKRSQELQQLAKTVEVKREAENHSAEPITEAVFDTNETETTEEETEETMSILEEYQELFEENSDLVGWIRLEDTKLDSPVMQSDRKSVV